MATSSEPPTKFNVALIQMKPKPNDPEANFTYAKEQIERATASQSISLVILPEYHLTGFDPSSSDFIPCCQTSHQYVAKYQALAKTQNVNICAGTIVLTPEPEEPSRKRYSMADDDRPTLLNTAYFIDNNGEILGSYTKTNLWHPEREHLTSSIEHTKPSSHEEELPEPHQVIQTTLGPVGILICWDLAFPEAFRALIMAGAKIILIPTYWLLSDMSDEGLRYNKQAEKLFLQTTMISRAFENTCAVIFCNAGGPAEEGFIGVSQVALPIVGSVEGSFTDSTEGCRVAEVDMEIVEVAERNYKVREDIQREDWHYGYERSGAK